NGERMARGSPERIRQKAPDLPGALAPATARVTLGWRLIEVGTQVQFAAELCPARCAPEVEPGCEVLFEVFHLCRHPLRPKRSFYHHRFCGGQLFEYCHQVAAHCFEFLVG